MREGSRRTMVGRGWEEDDRENGNGGGEVCGEVRGGDRVVIQQFSGGGSGGGSGVGMTV